jgi:hypothetical protein
LKHWCQVILLYIDYIGFYRNCLIFVVSDSWGGEYHPKLRDFNFGASLSLFDLLIEMFGESSCVLGWDYRNWDLVW